MFSLQIRTWLVVLFLVATVPGAALLVDALSEQRRSLTAQIEHDLQNTATIAANQLSDAIQLAHGALSTVAGLPSVTARAGQECSATARDIITREPGYLNVGVADAAGEIFCSAVSVPERTNVSSRKYFQRAMKSNDLVVGEYVINLAQGRPALHAAHSVVHRGKRIAVAFAALDVSYLEAALSTVQREPGQVLTVMDGAGVIVARYPDRGGWVGARHAAPIVDRMLADERGLAEVAGVDGVSRMYALVPLLAAGRPTDIRIAVGVERAEALAPVEQLFRRSLIVYGVVGTLGLVAAWALGEFAIVKGLRQVSHAARRLSRGDLAARSGLRSTAGEIGALAGTFDEMAAALEELTRQNRLILECVGVGILGVDRQGRVTFVNQTAAEMLKSTVADLVRRELAEVLGGPGDGSRTARLIATATSGGSHRLERQQLLRRTGEPFPADVIVTPIRHEGQIVGSVVTLHDVAERVHLELQLRQSQKLEAIGRLAGGVAHDFNNLLSVILSAGRYLADELPPGHALRTEADEVVAAGERAAGLTRQLLAFSRNQVLRASVLDPNELVNDVRMLLERVIGEDIEIALSLRAEGRVRADAGQVGQVILNLAVNARDAMAHGGRLTIETADVLLDPEQARGRLGAERGAYVMFAVTDTGCGMDEGTQSKIFEPFFTTKPVNQGTGLGLSVVWGIVKQFGGDIHVYSTVGRGTTIKIFLPLVQDDATRAVRQVEVEDVRGTETVLLVEDNDMVREVAGRTLRRAGYQVLEARRPREALRLVADGCAMDVLLTDVVMPDMSGPELVARVAELRPAVPVVFMSGYTGASLEHQNVLERGADFVDKPFTADTLLRAVRARLEHARAARVG